MSVSLTIPYGRTGMTCELPAQNLNGIFESALPPAPADQNAEVKPAMDVPIGSLPLEQLARGKRSAVVIASDHTRPVPSKIIMPQILKRLRQGSPAIDITILIAAGCHRKTTREELIAKFGEAIVTREKIVLHDASDASMLVRLGTLPSGGELLVNKLAVETDLLVAEGFIEPHFFAGFSGGRKSVLPGISSRQTVLANHCSEFIQSPFARTGILENNPIHRDMVFAARQARLAFIVNVVIDPGKKIVRAFAGDSEKAHLAGCEFLRNCCKVNVPVSDIVITSNGGYPLDQNVYQCVKGMTAGEAVCREGGVIILAAACNDGHGGQSFFDHLAAQSPEEILKSVSSVPRNQTVPDQWQYQILARVLAKHTVIMVTGDCNHRMIETMNLLAASTIQEALDKAFQLTGAQARIAVIPDGVSVIPYVE